MTPSEREPDDRALDVMLETIARGGAPRDFATRVSATLDASNATPIAGRRVRFAMAAAAGLLAIAVAVWIAPQHPASPPTPVLSRSTPTPPAHASPAPEVVAPSTTPETALALGTARETHGNQSRPFSREDDHDRALPALGALPALLQPDIAPPSLETTSIDIERMNAIAPLTVQGGRDTSGRGDF